jgi:hypothetical protein
VLQTHELAALLSSVGAEPRAMQGEQAQATIDPASAVWQCQQR